MTTVQISYCSSSKLACTSCLPADIILCVPEEFVAPHLCSDDLTDQTYQYRHIVASLTAYTKSVDCAFNTVYTYTFEFDDEQIVTDSGFLASDVTGVFCKGCLTNWIEDIVGNEIEIDVGDYEVTITSQHGCETTFTTGGGSTSSGFQALYSSLCPTETVEVVDAEQDLLSYTVPADTFSECGVRANYKANVDVTINGATTLLTIKVYLGALEIDSIDLDVSNGAAQDLVIDGFVGVVVTDAPPVLANVTSSNINSVFATINVATFYNNFSGVNDINISDPQILKITAQADHADGAFVAVDFFTVDLIGPPETCESGTCSAE